MAAGVGEGNALMLRCTQWRCLKIDEMRSARAAEHNGEKLTDRMTECFIVAAA